MGEDTFYIIVGKKCTGKTELALRLAKNIPRRKIVFCCTEEAKRKWTDIPGVEILSATVESVKNLLKEQEYKLSLKEPCETDVFIESCCCVLRDFIKSKEVRHLVLDRNCLHMNIRVIAQTLEQLPKIIRNSATSIQQTG